MLKTIVMEKLLFLLCELYVDWLLANPRKREKIYTEMKENYNTFLCTKFDSVFKKKYIYKWISSLYGVNSIYYQKFSLNYFIKYMPELYTSIVTSPWLKEEIRQLQDEKSAVIDFTTLIKNSKQEANSSWFKTPADYNHVFPIRSIILQKAISLTFSQTRFNTQEEKKKPNV